MMEWNNAQNGGEAPRGVKNIYARGADDGFWMGLYFTALFGLTVASLDFPAANILAAVMVLGVPFLTYFLLRRTHVAAHGMTVFSALWMQGIVMFGCGSLILGCVSFVYLRWIEPGFMARVLQAGIDYYSAIDSDPARAVADEFRMIVKGNAIPSALNVTMGWMWLGMFSGSLLSMLTAGIVRMRRVGNTNQRGG